MSNGHPRINEVNEEHKDEAEELLRASTDKAPSTTDTSL